MSNHPHPTSAQLRYIKALALQRGRTFEMPQTRSQASSLIDQLKRTPRNTITEQRVDLRAVQDAMQTQAGDAARIRDDELDGFGSKCQWSHLVHDE